jgi:hypothetical protein
MLRKQLHLPFPSEAVLKRRIRQFFRSPGICSMTLELLKQKLAKESGQNCLASLCFDGMSLSPSIRYSQQIDKVIGCEEPSRCDNNQALRPINEAVVAVLRGITTNWKQPIAYYPVYRSLGQSGFAAAIDECLRACHRAGIQIVALVADQETTQWAYLSRQVSE